MVHLEGAIDKITFYNEDNFYTIAKLKLKNNQVVTIVGNLPPLYIGEELLIKGDWVQHKDYGEQFQIEAWENKTPQTVLGIERFLGSGLLKGVGLATAQKITRHFGVDSLDIILNSPEQLLKIPGFSMAKANRIADSLRERGEIQRIMVFLQGFGVSPGYALKIFRNYRNEAIKVVKENPYRLADDVFGIGFKIADQIAQKMGVNNDSPYRIRAGIRYWLNQNSSEGHIYAVEKDFIVKASKELEVNEAQLTAELEELLIKKELFREYTNNDNNLLYLAPFYYSEIGVVSRLNELLNVDPSLLNVDVAKVLIGFPLKIKLPWRISNKKRY